MKKYFFLLITPLLLISLTTEAQEKWFVEFRPALNFPTRDLGDTDSKIGSGFELTGAYQVMPHLAIYAGWGWNQFKGEDNNSSEISFDERGYTFGLQIVRNIGTSSFSYFARAGAVYNLIKFENNAGDISLESKRGIGWQAELGLDYEFAYNLSLRPSLRYRALSSNLDFDNTSTNLDLNYISFGVGLAWNFDL